MDSSKKLRTGQSLPITLLRARETAMMPVRAMLAEIGVTEQQWRVLRVLEEDGPLGPTELSHRAVLLLPSLTRILQGLETRGLIARQTVADDRRRQRIAATSDGLALIRDNLVRAREIAQFFRDRLGAEKHQQLLDLLNELAGIDTETRSRKR